MGSIQTADVKYSSDEEPTLRLMSSTSTVFRAAFVLVAAVVIIWSQHYAYVGDESLVDSLVRPGHPSTPGYNDPNYPLTGRPVGAPA